MMGNIFRLLVVVAGAAVSLLQFLARLAPDTVHRLDVPFEDSSSEHTYDGKQIVD